MSVNYTAETLLKILMIYNLGMINLKTGTLKENEQFGLKQLM